MNEFDKRAWEEIMKALGETPSTNSIYSYSVDLTKMQPKQEELSVKDQLEVLRCAIDYSLDVKNENEFKSLTKKYINLKAQLQLVG